MISNLQLSIIMSAYCGSDFCKIFPDTPTFREQEQTLINNDIIKPTGFRSWKITDKGKAYLDHILATPFPVSKTVLGNSPMNTIHKTSAPAEVNEFRKDLITYFQNQATSQRTQAAIATRKYTVDKHTAKAETYDMNVRFLQSIKIESE